VIFGGTVWGVLDGGSSASNLMAFFGFIIAMILV